MDVIIFARYFLLFMLASFLGWIVEELVVAAQCKRFANRGFLIGPILPIYGFGAVLGALTLGLIQFSPILVFVASFFGAGLIEYLTSFWLEKAFGARWWDYSHRKFNIHGRVCLLYLLAFGVFGVLFTYVIWPPLHGLLFAIPELAVAVLAIILAILLAADFIISCVVIKDFKKLSRSEPTDDTEDITTYVRKQLAAAGRLHRRLNAFNFIIPPRTLYYNSYDDDFLVTRNQDYQLPAHYQWIRRHNRPVLYFFGFIWARLHRLCHGIKYENRQLLKDPKLATCFIYANHTQGLSDILCPVDYCFSRRIRLLANPANFAIPVLGPLLPDLGALPVTDKIHDLAKLEQAIKHYSKLGQPIIIYPEAHVWPFYTEIRPLPVAAFGYPVRLNAPVITATTIYKKRRFGRKPRMIIRFDGPFYPNPDLSRRDASAALCEQVTAVMKKAASCSNFKYIKYRKSRRA